MATQAAQRLDERDLEDQGHEPADDRDWEPADKQALHEALWASVNDPTRLDARRLFDDQPLRQR